jgi:uncharacterized membrane protein
MLIIVLAAMSLGVGGLFWFLGAWPVPGFLGIDVVLLYAAFRQSYRQARAAEEIRLCRSALTVRRVRADGTATVNGLNPYWARLEVERHPEFGILRMAVAWQGKRLAIGRFLPPPSREKFAREFAAALAAARAAPAPL